MMTQRHKHADVIIAWAEGKQIQILESRGWVDWVLEECPVFSVDSEYRIKPAEPVVVRWLWTNKRGVMTYNFYSEEEALAEGYPIKLEFTRTEFPAEGSMTDRELLELAAKAAGVDVYESTDGTIQNRPVLVFSAGGGMGTLPYEERWNPLSEDAQAFRLAVKLHIDIDTYSDGVQCIRTCDIDDNLDLDWCHEHFGSDPYAATRRAIVRAAAEIGRGMK